MRTWMAGLICVLTAPGLLAQNVRTQVMIVLPADGAAGISARDIGEAWARLVEDDSPAAPGEQPIVPRGGVTAIGVVVYSEQSSSLALAPTLVQADSVSAIAAALRGPAGDNDAGRAGPAGAIRTAAESLAASGLGGYRHVLVLLDESAMNHEADLLAARDEAIGLVDQVNAMIFVRGERSPLTRRWLMERVCDSRRRLASGWEGSLAIAAEVHLTESKGDEDPPMGGPCANEDHIAFAVIYDSSNHGGPFFGGPWGPVQQRVLMRLTVCPGDYDRDGDVDGTDANAFIIGFNSTPPELYADWNFDNQFMSIPDKNKFDAEHANACASP